MSPLVAYRWSQTVQAQSLTADAIGAHLTTPVGVVKSLPPVTGILTGLRIYGPPTALLVTLEVTADGATRSRTVTSSTIVTLTDPPV